MIEKLEPVFEKCSDGVARQFPPHPYDMMKKINELVEAVNRMEKQIGYPQYEVGNRKRE